MGSSESSQQEAIVLFNKG